MNYNTAQTIYDHFCLGESPDTDSFGIASNLRWQEFNDELAYHLEEAEALPEDFKIKGPRFYTEGNVYIYY